MPVEHRPPPALFPSLAAVSLEKKHDEILHDFHLASSASELVKIVADIDEEMATLDGKLTQFVVSSSRKHTQELATIDLNRAKLSGAIAQSSELTSVFLGANDLGHALTAKIRTLDHEIGNVDRTLKFVLDIQLLKLTINKINYAIEKHEWEEAAHGIHTINHKLDADLVAGKFALAAVPLSELPELPIPTIEKWVHQLKLEFERLFHDAAKRRSVPEISRYFQLFPLIDQEELGLSCYSKFICSVIADTSRALVSSVSQNEARPGSYSSVASSLFESVSKMLSQHTPLIRRHYEETHPEAITFVVTRVQREIDTQISIIADSFYDANRLDKVLQDIQLHSFAELKRKIAETLPEEQQLELMDSDLVSVVEIGDLIHELGAILHHWSLYCKFVVVKYFGQTTSQEVPSLLVNSHFAKKVHQTYLPAFELLYKFYLRRSVEKALTIEELPSLEPYLLASSISRSPELAPISSVVEDVTLVFNNVLRSVLESGQASTVKAFASVSFQIILRDVIEGFIKKRLVDFQPRYNMGLTLISQHDILSGTASPSTSRAATPVPEVRGGFFKGASSALGNVVGTGTAMVSNASLGNINNPKLMQYVVYLNTVAAGQEFLTQVVNNLVLKNLSYLTLNFPFGIDAEKVKNIIKSEFLERFISITSSMIKSAIVTFFNQLIKARISSMVADLLPDSSDANYLVYNSAVLNDTTSMIKFKQSWEDTMRPFKQTLHRSLVYDKLLNLVVVNFVNMLERRLMTNLKTFKINELGGLKLDKDLSFIIALVCDEDYELREKFVRITQLVLLVSMDDEEYELSTFGGDEDGVNWILTPLERKQIRRFRV